MRNIVLVFISVLILTFLFQYYLKDYILDPHSLINQILVGTVIGPILISSIFTLIGYYLSSSTKDNQSINLNDWFISQLKEKENLLKHSDYKYEELLKNFNSLKETLEKKEDKVSKRLLALILEYDFEKAEQIIISKLEGMDKVNQINKISLYSELAKVYFLQFKFEEAIKIHKKELKIYNNLNLYEDEIQCLLNLVILNKSLGNYSEALRYAYKALENNKKNLNDEVILNIYNDIGLLHFLKGDFKNALLIFKKCLFKNIKIHGIYSSNTATSLHNIGTSKQIEGLYKKALLYYKKALKIRIKLLGEEHLDTADSFNNIASINTKFLNAKESIINYKKTYKIRQSILGDKDPRTLHAKENIARGYLILGDFEKANDLISSILNYRVSLLGKTHIETSCSYFSKGEYHLILKEYNIALSYFKKSMKIRLFQLGRFHSDTIMSFFKIGCTLYSLKIDFDKSIKYLLIALENQKKISINHPLLIEIYDYLSLNYSEKYNSDKTIYYTKKAISLIDKKDKNLYSLYYRIGHCYYLNSKIDDAIKCFNKAILTIPEIEATKSDYCTIINELAVCYYLKQNYSKAFEYAKKALNLRIKLYGEKNIAVSESYSILSNIYHAIKDLTNAIKYAQQSLNIKTSLIKNKSNLSIAMQYYNIGNLLTEIGEYHNSFKYHAKALKIRKKLLPPLHFDIAQSYNNIATIYYYFKNFEASLKYYDRALHIRIKVLKKGDINVIDSYINIGTIYLCINEIEKALEYHSTALMNLIKFFGKDFYRTKEQFNFINECYGIKEEDIIKTLY